MILDEYEKFRKALAMVESSNNPNAIGDGGRSWGRYQMHPAWFSRYLAGVDVYLSDSWDDYMERVLRHFFEPTWTRQVFALTLVQYGKSPNLALRMVAMEFHIGHQAIYMMGDWDAEYDNKFCAALNEIDKKNDAHTSSVG